MEENKEMPNRNNNYNSFDFTNYLQKYGTLTVIVIIAVIFTIINPQFMSINNILNISLQFSFIAILAIGILFPMITGVFDLTSTEMIFFISAMGAGLIRNNIVTTVPGVILTMVLIGVAVGFIKALAVTYLRLPSLLVTLAVGQSLMGIGRWYTKNQAIYITGKIDNIALVAEGKFLGIPIPMVILFFLIIIFYILLYKSNFGNRLYVMGGTELAAEEASINVKFYQTIAYIISGVMGSISALIVMARIRGAKPDVGSSFTIVTIASVFVGMSMFKRGEPNLLGTVFAVLMLSLITNGFVMIGLSIYIQDVITGILILATVSLSVYLRRFKQL